MEVVVAQVRTSQALFLAAANTVGMRRLAAAAVHARVCGAFPGLDFMTRLERRVLLLQIKLSRWWWLALGVQHLRVRAGVMRQARAELATVKADVVLKVRFRE